MRVLGGLILCSAVIVVGGCAKKENASSDSAAMSGAAASQASSAPPRATAFSMADAAGKWQVRAVPETGKDTTPTNYVMTATSDTTGWMITFPSGLKVPLKVMPSGDSVLITTGTFASQRRKGVKVRTEGSFRVQNGKLVGVTTAYYAGATTDTVLRLRTEGTKLP